MKDLNLRVISYLLMIFVHGIVLVFAIIDAVSSYHVALNVITAAIQAVLIAMYIYGICGCAVKMALIKKLINEEDIL